MKNNYFIAVLFLFFILSCKNTDNNTTQPTSTNNLTNHENVIDTTDNKLIVMSDTVDVSKKDTVSKPKISTQGKEYTSKYICPNHCKGSGNEKPGVCSVCGMDLMQNPNQ